MKNLVKVSYLIFNDSPGYTNHCGDACLGESLATYDDFYTAKNACDKDKECGCFDVNYRISSPFKTHYGFLIEKMNDTARLSAWVKIYPYFLFV